MIASLTYLHSVKTCTVTPGAKAGTFSGSKAFNLASTIHTITTD